MSSFDVVIIGSGAGGSPVAATLAAAGASVLVVEKGRAYTRDDFDRDEIEWCRRDRFVPSPHDDPHTRRNQDGLVARPTTDGWISTVVGGGTVHMGAYMLRADRNDATQATRLGANSGTTAIDWAVPFDDIARFYDAAEQAIGVSGVPSTGMPALTSHSVSSAIDDAAKKLGLPSVPTPRGILTAARPDDDRKPCAYRQLCASYGCPNDAKGSMSVSFLRQAAKQKGFTLWTGAMATRIEAGEGDLASAVVVRKSDGTEERVTAGRIVVAAGAIESARLLLLSGEKFNRGGTVGKNLWFSLFVETVGFLDRKTFESRFPDLMHGSSFLNRTVLQGGNLDENRKKSSGVDRSGTLQLGFVHDNPIHRAERVATENGLLFGSALKKALKHAFLDGRQILVEGFGESVPHPGAYIDLDPKIKDRFGLPAARITHFHHPRDLQVAGQIGEDAKALLTEMGASDVKVTRRMSETMVLQGGTCRFGTDASTSVTTPTGALHGIKNVFVTDGGSLPSSTTVPITLTIVANALRIADGMKKT